MTGIVEKIYRYGYLQIFSSNSLLFRQRNEAQAAGSLLLFFSGISCELDPYDPFAPFAPNDPLFH